jgi:hypothetical protein
MQLPVSDKDIRTFLNFDNCFCNSTTMIRSQLAKELKYLQDYDIIEDYELWQRISKKTKLANIPEYTTLYRVHGDNISIQKQQQMFVLTKKINMQKLCDLNIPFSEQELNIHASFLAYDNVPFRKMDDFISLQNWILKIYHQFQNYKQYNTSIVYKILSEKWIVMCFKGKKIPMVLFNKFIFRHPALYLNVLYCKIFNKAIRY